MALSSSGVRRRSKPRGVDPILVSGVGAGHPFAVPIQNAFGEAVVFGGAGPAVLAVGIRAGDGEEWRFDFARGAFKAGIPCLGVDIDDNVVQLGPVALPERAGCWNCARERVFAARAAFDRPAAAAIPLTVSAALAGPLLVREIRAILRRGAASSPLVDHVLAVNAATCTASLHRVVPLSRCAVCGGAAVFPRLAPDAGGVSPGHPPETVIEALAGLLDWRTGIVARLVLESPADTGLDVPLVATVAPPHVVDGQGALRRLGIGWGKGLTMSGAILSAVGEAIERYAPSLPDPESITWSRPSDLDGEFLDPRAFPLYTDAQYAQAGFPYARFDPEVAHPWVPGWWLGDGKPVWVPAVFAFLALKLRAEQLICQGTSSGLAAHTETGEAALRAVLELVERDALLAAWLSGRPGRRIELDDTLEPPLRQVLQGIEGLGASVGLYVFDTAACGVTVLSVARGDGERYPGATIALGSDLDAASAVRQAILELGQTGPHLRRMMRSGALAAPADSAAVREMLDHAAWYFPVERAVDIDRLCSGGPPVPLRALTGHTPERSLAACAAALREAGVRVALIDVTSPDIATGPFRVIRAVSPDLEPLWYGSGFERPPVPRIRAMGVARDIPPVHPIW